MAADDMASHLLAHQLEQEELQQAKCGAAATLLAAAEQLDDEAAAALAAAEWAEEGGFSSDSEEQLHRQELEELYFQQLGARYGFTTLPRSGGCRLCGKEGHWAADCARNPDRQEAQRRVLNPPIPQRIAAMQQPAAATQMPHNGSLVQLLAVCLQQQQLPASAEYCAGVCGEVQHFGSSLYSSGWGCGYNSLQMLLSTLIASRQEAREALFAGAGFVPDIPALQAWLEAAWRAGFDVQGAEQLGHSVQGSKKWVGTTEAAALLRQFGLRAQIVDFGTPTSQLRPATNHSAMANKRTEAPLPVHSSIACGSCGQHLIVGDRYRSQVLPGYDLCENCHAKGSGTATGPYQRMLPAAALLPDSHKQEALGTGAGAHGSVAAKLLSWVWRYFMGAEEERHSSINGSAPQDGSAPSTKRQRLSCPPRVCQTGKLPLYFQHEGHSRVIVGIERRLVGRERRAVYSLLVLDSRTPGSRLAAALSQRSGWQRLLWRKAHTLCNPQYQLLFVQAGLANGAELESLKVVAAIERF